MSAITITRKAVTAVTEKQQRFCEEYLIDLNATQAA
ncbi:MAG: terminase small subunit, partial [Clostridiales bacterium]|nr:terminase small subunit [Clostridiales bacterium]MCI8389003.1 terminase small subunit [Clostridiales bacterium]